MKRVSRKQPKNRQLRKASPVKQIEEIAKQFAQLEREYKHRDSIWEARLRYARRGLEVTNRELGVANSKLAQANKELTGLRKHLEKEVEKRIRELRFERDRVQHIITQLSDGLLLLDQRGKILLVNEQAEHLLDTSKERILGISLDQLQTLPAAGPLFHFLEERKIPQFHERLEVKDADSRSKVLEITKTPLLIAGRTEGTMVLLHDVTREAAVDKLKSEFLSLAAHQLRTPLSALKWIFRMAIDGDVGALTEEQKEFLQKGYVANERMISLINDLLHVVRIEEGRFNYRFLVCSLWQIIEEIATDAKALAAKKQIEIFVHGPSHEFPEVRIDQEKFRLAVTHLVRNAIEYTPPGGQVDITAIQEPAHILVSIQDTGIGILQEQLDQVFKKFFRGANAVRMQTEGSGLGLFITKNIIEKHGGRVWIESEEGKGTTVRFTIPIPQNKVV